MGYSASRWGKLELARATPEEVVEGDTAKEYFGSSGEHDHED
jgi:hypothetical protein